MASADCVVRWTGKCHRGGCVWDESASVRRVRCLLRRHRLAPDPCRLTHILRKLTSLSGVVKVQSSCQGSWACNCVFTATRSSFSPDSAAKLKCSYYLSAAGGQIPRPLGSPGPAGSHCFQALFWVKLSAPDSSFRFSVKTKQKYLPLISQSPL